MKIPNSNRKKALILVDVQSGFITDKNEYVLDNIVSLTGSQEYDAYVETLFATGDSTLWASQVGWEQSGDEVIKTDSRVGQAILGKETLTVTKSSRSAFKGDVDLDAYLNERQIEEVHLVGYATHDCVLATAFDAFDRGYYTYVIEECCESHTPGRHDLGVELLRYQKMTNNSCLVSTKEI